MSRNYNLIFTLSSLSAALCLSSLPAQATITITGGGETIISSYVSEDIIVTGSSSASPRNITVTTGGYILPSLSDLSGITINSTSYTNVSVEGSGAIYGSTNGEGISTTYYLTSLNMSGQAVIGGGYGATQGGNAVKHLDIGSSISSNMHGDSQLLGGEGGVTGGYGIDVAHTSIQLYDNSQIIGGYGGTSGGIGFSTARGSSGLGRLNMYDNSLVRGGDGGSYGGNALDNMGGFEGLSLTMYGGQVIGGDGAISGGHAAGYASADPGNSRIYIYNGLVQGGTGGVNGGVGSLTGHADVSGGVINGGAGGTQGGDALEIRGSYGSPSILSGGTISGGFGGEYGGTALSLGGGPGQPTVEIAGGHLQGGDSNQHGGDAIDILRGGGLLTISGGLFDAGLGSVSDGWLIQSDPMTTLYSTVEITGGLFGSENVGQGFGLWGESYFDIFGRSLSLADGMLTGWLLDGNYINVPVFFDTSFTGAFNLHNAAVPLPPAILLFGSGLLSFLGIARRR